jgi:hypothetical protein
VAVARELRAGPGLWTSVDVRAGRASYTVRTEDPVFQERLEHMGYPRTGATTFTRVLSATGDVTRVHANFARHLEEMLLQSARLRPVAWERALGEVLRRVEGSRLDWFLYGSGALAVRGIDAGPGDLDLWVGDAHHAGEIFADLLVEPVTEVSGWIADAGGRAFHGCLFEWIAGVHPSVDEPEPHEQGQAAHARRETVRWRGHDVMLAPLDLQLAVAERRGLTERAATIRRALRER